MLDRVRLFFYEKKHPESPWLTQRMVEMLGQLLRPSDVGMEFGSGRSTVWLAGRVSKLISVEHDRFWAEKTLAMLTAKGLRSRVDFNFLPEYAEHAGAASYVDAVKSVDDGSLDFCLIDGIRRDECAVACLSKVRSGGFIVVDNANWYLPRDQASVAPNSRGLRDGYASELWGEYACRVEGWRSIWTSNGICDTAIWFRP